MDITWYKLIFDIPNFLGFLGNLDLNRSHLQWLSLGCSIGDHFSRKWHRFWWLQALLDRFQSEDWSFPSGNTIWQSFTWPWKTSPSSWEKTSGTHVFLNLYNSIVFDCRFSPLVDHQSWIFAMENLPAQLRASINFNKAMQGPSVGARRLRMSILGVHHRLKPSETIWKITERKTRLGLLCSITKIHMAVGQNPGT